MSQGLYKSVNYCTGGSFVLVSLLGGMHRYNCNKCGMVVCQSSRSTVTLPSTNHYAVATISAFFQPTTVKSEVSA